MNAAGDAFRGVRQFSRWDWIVVTLGVVIAFLLRAPFRSHMAYHWDSALFVLAIRKFDLLAGEPQMPGYFLYVMLGRLVTRVAGDPHTSLVWISVVFGSMLPSVVYILGTVMFGRWAGATAGLMALTSPQTWFHSCVALTYIVDSFLVCVLVLVLWQARERGVSWMDAIMVGVLLAIIGGIREQSAIGIGVMVIFVFWWCRQARTAKLLVMLLVATGLSAVWFVPMVRSCGGWQVYVALLNRNFKSNALTSAGDGFLATRGHNFASVVGFCWIGLVLGAFILLGALLYRALFMSDDSKETWNDQHARGLSMLAVWIMPMMILGTIIATDQPGHVLGYLPAWFVLTGLVVACLKHGWQRVALIAAIGITNVFAFVAWPQQWDGVFFEMARTAREIRVHDAELTRIVRTVRQSYASADVVIYHAGEDFLYGIRHFQLYLPEYDHYQLGIDLTTPHPPGRPMWRVRNGHLEFVDSFNVGPERQVLLFVPPDEKIDVFDPYLSQTKLRSLAKNVVR